MTQPVPVFDHFVVNVRTRMDEAVGVYERLGFALTPRGHHTLGSINHLAVFATNYLELVGLPPEGPVRADILGSPPGMDGLVFATDDAAAVQQDLAGRGLAFGPPGDFSRPVALPEGTQDAAFRTTRLAAGHFAAGRLYFCEHKTRHLVWRDAWRRHPNGVREIIGGVLATDAVEKTAALFADIFGADALRPLAGGGVTLLAGAAGFDILPHDIAARRLADAGPAANGRAQIMAAIRLRCADLARVQAILRASDIGWHMPMPDRLVVPAADAMDVALEFVM